MPQDLALHVAFSIRESLEYYSKLHGMSPDEFEHRKGFLMKFLDIPSEDRIIGNLSGGQKRRVSLCIALLHNPKLLILDEPTVGVDPVLRAKIWKYLVAISKGGTSVVITTHYIEEAAMANIVGFMRGGKILDEGTPQRLMETYNRRSLEDVFLLLCQKK
jgi:ABC-type multidrug transport system ATPase subunit